MITHKCVSWAGGHLHEISDGFGSYAVFTFTDDRNKSMTTNIIMNIFIPNVIMVFVAAISEYLEWTELTKRVYLFVVFFYIYRAILICIILNRKEMYNLKYELSIAFIGILSCTALYHFFIKNSKKLLITTDELREQLWFAVILVLYSFIKSVLDVKIKQDNILERKQIINYIKNKFEKFWKKYNKCLEVNYDNRYICILIYSIMLFEDFNRSFLTRKMESIVLKVRGYATVGIMQVKSERRLSDEESIRIVYERLKEKIPADEYLDEMWVNSIAMEYNPDSNYAYSVAYIYARLLEIILEDSEWQSRFYMGLKEESVDKDINYDMSRYECEKWGTLVNVISDNTELILQRQNQWILKDVYDNKFVSVEGGINNWGLVFHDLNNVIINGQASLLLSTYASNSIITLRNCKNITLKNFKLWHMNQVEEGEGYGINLDMCSNIIIDGIELYGCSNYAINSYESVFSILNSKIHDCWYGAIFAYDSEITLKNVKIFNCKKLVNNLIENDNGVNMENVELYNNKMNLDFVKTQSVEYSKVSIHDNKYRKDSHGFQFDNRILWENNEHMGWI